MNKLLISLLLSSTLIGGVQAQKKENYYVKHVEFPQDATLEQKVDMAARLVPTPQQYAWQQMELTAFLHFGINTFTGREWTMGEEFEKCRFQNGYSDRKASRRFLPVAYSYNETFCSLFSLEERTGGCRKRTSESLR